MKLPSEYVAQGWCQGALARSKTGEPVSPHSPSAVSWCLIGAIERALDPNALDPNDSVMTENCEDMIAFFTEQLAGSLGIWNDRGGQAKVIAVLRLAETAVRGVVHEQEAHTT